MKKTLKFTLIFLSSYLLFGCSYDDDALWSEIDQIKTDISSLKEQVSSVQTVVDALNAGKIITEVKELESNKGYTITFNDGKSIKILNGEDGKAGKDGADGKNGTNGTDGADGKDGVNGTNGKDGADAPIVGIQEAEGTYYWTLTTEGEKDFLVDNGGNKIPVSGEDGKTPELGIDEEGFWTVNQTQIKDKNGESVKAQGDSFFKEVKDEEDSVTFIFADDSSITLPKTGSTYLRFDSKDNQAFFVFKPKERKRLRIKFANIKTMEVIKKPEGWRTNIHRPDKYIELVAPENASYGIKEVIIKGLDENGLVFQAIAKVSIAGKAFSDPLGVFILNEGNMTTENGSLIFLNSKGEIFNRPYYNMNGRELGNVTQDLFIKDGKMYIISQNGNKNPIGTEFENDGMLIVANSETLRKEAAYSDELATLDWPTHIAVLDEENIFIRDNKGVHRFNTKTKELQFIEGTKGADKNTMAVANGKVFVPARSKVFVFEANNMSISHTIDMGDRISGILKSKDGNIWVATTGKPHKISKVDSETYAVLKANEITEGGLNKGWAATPGITAKGDTLYYSNASTKIYRHIFSKAETTFMVDAKTMVSDANIVYNNIAVHPVTGKVYMNTLKGFGWDFLVNNISEFDFSGSTPVLSKNYTDYTHFPAGIYFTYNFQ